MSRDTIFLEGLEIQAVIGIKDWERTVQQTVRIDLEMPADVPRAAEVDRIDATVNYQHVARRLTEYVSASNFRLVETLAERIAALLLEEYGVPWVRITVSKPGAIPEARNVGVRIERHRAQ